MIEVLAPSSNHRVLEIGTGSGYATALLARLAREVISIERFQSLAIEAGARLEQLGVDNAGVTWGDGAAIGPAAGPFDRIIVQGSLNEIPAPLIAALAAEGVLVTARPDPSAPARHMSCASRAMRQAASMRRRFVPVGCKRSSPARRRRYDAN